MISNEASIILKSLDQSSTGIVYSEKSNSFLSQGYISQANNLYFNSFLFAEGLIIKTDIGQGYAHTFLNGISLYHTKSKTLIADDRFHNYRYSKEAVIAESCRMLLDTLILASAKSGVTINIQEAKLAIHRIISDSINCDQLTFAKTASNKLLIHS